MAVSVKTEQTQSPRFTGGYGLWAVIAVLAVVVVGGISALQVQQRKIADLSAVIAQLQTSGADVTRNNAADLSGVGPVAQSSAGLSQEEYLAQLLADTGIEFLPGEICTTH